MSVAYEPRNFIHEGNYPPMEDDDHTGDARYGDDVAEQLSHYTTEAGMSLEDGHVMGDARGLISDNEDRFMGASLSSPLHLPVNPPQQVPDVDTLPSSKEVSPSAESPTSRGKASKPEREAIKGPDGKYHCNVTDCQEDIQSFSRKCEWNKHMDKHERPYRCFVSGCENLPGFTYSGGLLRHEREVHNKHGGPKKTVNCPHSTCKRHVGKGFSRQENLNEHLRRVHTNPEGETPPAEGAPSPEDNESEKSGTKRKRLSTGDAQIQYSQALTAAEETQQLRDENTLLREENQRLKNENEQHNRHTLSMMTQIADLQEALRLGHSLAPTAQMI